ncbi:MAG: DUF2155 domain-containing protein, partial [Proteobacteria bacterium]|nr:DUF2155 domain-containing protein [Pseudomonadota bacterium]
MAATVLAVNFTATTQGQPEEPQTAVVGALDKITARITELQLPLGRRVKFGTLRIAARFCYSRPPEETPETYIFLEIDDVLADGAEVLRYRTNPLQFDTDGDLLSDGEEVLYLKLSPKNPDSDRDGYSDGYEVTRGTNPRDHCSRPLRGPRFPG